MRQPGLGHNRPDTGNGFFGYRFPVEPESLCEHTQIKQVCSLRKTRADVQQLAENVQLESTILRIF